MPQPFAVDAVRAQFPGLARTVHGEPAVFFDGPAGSQVPRAVADAVADYLLHHNANVGGSFSSSCETGEILEGAAAALADLFGVRDPAEIVFGANMTSLTFELSRALAETWRPGDEVVVTRSDHDANVTPWVLAARDAGATVRHVPVLAADCTLDLTALRAVLGERTRLVAVGAASNLSGTIHPVAEIAAAARAAGALCYVDAVHYAPHRLLDARAWGCDFAVCSAYKLCGPHVGALWGRRELLESLPARFLRPAPSTGPGRWMHGTQNHEGIAGVTAAIDYLASLGAAAGDRRGRLRSAYAAIEAHESALCTRLLDGLRGIEGARVVGIADPARIADRAPTVSFTLERRRPQDLARWLAERGIFTWAGNSYALALTDALGLEPDGALRVGLLHYNTEAEVDRLLGCLADAPR